MLPVELALRTGTAAIFLVSGIVALRDWRRTDSGPFGGLLALSVAAVAVVSISGVASSSWLWPLLLLAMGAPALLWIWAGAVFVDDFRPTWRAALAWAVLPALAAFDLYARRPWIGTTDLRDIFYPGQPAGASGRIVEATLLAALALAFALAGLRAGFSLDDPPVVDTESHMGSRTGSQGPAAVQTPATEAGDQEDALLARLLRLMQEEKVYRQEGFGLNALVAALEVPEYRLRRLIHQRLGHRNFSSFVNGYRLAEVTAALADPGQADVAILTIALDAGFQSIGPFNRAFKAHTGMTPTAYRKQADSPTDRPISGIGQATTENGKT